MIFETLYADRIAVAAHARIDDESQTVELVGTETETLARDGVTGAHEATADERTLITDTVKIRDVIVGETYTVLGFLVDRQTGLLLVEDPSALDRDALSALSQEIFDALGAAVTLEDGTLHASFDAPGTALDRAAIERACAKLPDAASHLAIAVSNVTTDACETEVEQSFSLDTSALAGTEAVAYQFVGRKASS